MIAEVQWARIGISLTRLERWVLLKALTSPSLLEAVRNATMEGGRVRVLLTRGQFAHFREELEAESVATLSPRHRLTLKRIQRRLAAEGKGQPAAPEHQASKGALVSVRKTPLFDAFITVNLR